MKFCKNLQRVADLSNPEWVPFFTDYKKLKKVIKRLSDLELDGAQKQGADPESPSTHTTRSDTTGSTLHSPHSTPGGGTRQQPPPPPPTGSQKISRQQFRGDSTAEPRSSQSVREAYRAACAASSKPQNDDHHSPSHHPHHPQADSGDDHHPSEVDSLRRKPGEIMFFKLLHSEFQKAVHFFDRMIDELTIREERVVEGCEIVRRENRSQLWSMIAKSVYRLHTDLLLLENFCIMTYCSFSKILKKHDKVTGFDTRNAFMSNVVNKANFTNYTNLQAMIGRCEELYSEVSDRMLEEGQENLYEDERLFIEMVHQLNQQV